MCKWNPKTGVLLLCAIMMGSLALGVAAAETVPAADKIGDAQAGKSALLGWLSRQVRALADYEAPPPEPDPALEELKTMRRGLAEIRTGMEELRETLDFLINRVMADIEEENQLLRDEVRRLSALRVRPEDSGLPQLPRPGSELIEELLTEVPASAEFEGEAQMEAIAEPVEFTWSALKEWGRSPSEAAELGNASSLIGMICVVPLGSLDEDLEQLGRELRDRFVHYDNINIEVFDDIEAAQHYADTNLTDAARRVMSVSKHTASGRDVILLMGDGPTREIGF